MTTPQLGKGKKGQSTEEHQTTSHTTVAENDQNYESTSDSSIEDDDDDTSSSSESKISNRHVEHIWQMDEEKKRNDNKLKMGRWSKKEEKLLRENLEKYLDKYKIRNQKRLLFADFKTENGKKWKELCKSTGFYRALAKGLNRSLFLVYRKAKRTFNKKNYLGRFTRNEDKKLLELVASHGKKWSKISTLMKRSKLAISHRYEFIKDRPKHNTGPWEHDEVERLKKAVRQVTNTQDGDEVYSGIRWNAVAALVKTRNSTKCREKWIDCVCWKECNQTIAGVWGPEHEIDLITRIYESKVTDEMDINWTALTEEMEISRSPTWLSRKFVNIKRKYGNSDSLDEPDFEDVIEHLYKVVVVDLRKEIAQNLYNV